MVAIHNMNVEFRRMYKIKTQEHQSTPYNKKNIEKQ